MGTVAILCSICGLVGAIWIAVLAFQEGEILWGVFSLLCGIVALIYGVQHLEEAKVPLILLIIGIAGNVVARVVMMGGG